MIVNGIRQLAIFLVLTSAGFARLEAAIFFDEDFNGSSLSNNLSDTDAAFGLSGGTVRRSFSFGSEDRHYIETVASGYNALDFIAEITFTLTNTDNGSSNIIFFGLGSGIPDGTYHNEPGDSVFFRFHALDDPNPPFRGAADVAANPTGNAFNDVTYFDLRSLTTANGTHRAQIEKIGNSIVFAVDDNFDGVFSADLSLQIADLNAVAPFLNSSNSHLFFGTAGTVDSFDDFSVRAVPEPASLVTWGLITLCGVTTGWRMRLSGKIRNVSTLP